ncbi:tsukushi-like [Adelges cooleyi]|uniref:tsukushi-like n=1 Tax=Adelges cooleyi TaxID=133065 RepID=UPI00217FC726|nr:tsukushi-like [Adelges cooleyi]
MTLQSQSTTGIRKVVLLLLAAVSTVSALYRVKCFDHNKGEDETGIILDCADMAGKSHPYPIESWIGYHAYFDDGIKANQVVQIDLSNNDFQRIFKMPPMTSLQKLSFKYNNLTSIERLAFCGLPALEELDISYNTLPSDELRPAIICHPKSSNGQEIKPVRLKTLRLGHNNIHTLRPDFFEHLTQLEVLELNNNPFKVIDQNTEFAISNLCNLQVLDLANTGIAGFPSESFSHSNVNTLYLNGNNFQSVPNEIRAMPLAYLNLNANPISNLNAESFVGFQKLQQLIISGMPKLSQIDSGTFAPLPRLITLHMSHNPNLVYIHYDAFRNQSIQQWWSLRQLFLNNNKLGNIDSKLYPWGKLDIFDAKSNPWTCDCRLSWMANYVNETFKEIPETLLYYRCHEPQELDGILVSQLNEHIECDELFQAPADHSHGHVTRLRHFIIVIGLVIGIFVFGTLINMGCRKLKKVLEPRISVPARFSSGVKYRPADFEEISDTPEELSTRKTSTMIHGRPPIVINQSE